MFIKKNAVILFQGDSITDCDRDRKDDHSLGQGYPMFVSSWFQSLYPQLNVEFLNRGISGDRVKDLQSRWQQDCLDLKPDLLSILVGVNDTVRRYDSNDPTGTEEFKKTYQNLIKQVKKDVNPDIMLIEPFLLPVSKEQKKWREDLDPKINVVKELAREFKTMYLPLDDLFARACKKKEPSFWAEDGVHPTPAGHFLIARAWMGTIEKYNREKNK